MKKPCLPLKNEWRGVTNINEQNGVLMEEKKGYSDVCDQLMSERRNVMDCIKGLRDQRDEFSQEVSSKDSRSSAAEFERDL